MDVGDIGTCVVFSPIVSRSLESKVVASVFVIVPRVLIVAASVLVVVALCVVDSEVNPVVSRVVKCDIDDIVVGVSVGEFVELHVLLSEVEK